MSTSPPLNQKTYLTGLAIAISGAVLFSAKAIIAKLLYRYHIDALTVLSFRMIFSLPCFAIIALWKAATSESLSNIDYGRVVVLGLLGYYLSSFLDFSGLQYISAGLERLILFLTPSFVLLISVGFLKKKIVPLEWIALLISYSGVFLVFMHDALKGGSHIALGSAYVFCSAITYALYLLFSGELLKVVGSIRLVAYAMCVSSLACLTHYSLTHPLSTLMQQVHQVYFLSIANAVFCTVMPVFLTMIAVSRLGAGTASQAGMIGPVSTLLMGAWFLNEPITSIQIVGTTFVLAGIYLLSRKPV